MLAGVGVSFALMKTMLNNNSAEKKLQERKKRLQEKKSTVVLNQEGKKKPYNHSHLLATAARLKAEASLGSNNR